MTDSANPGSPRNTCVHRGPPEHRVRRSPFAALAVSHWIEHHTGWSIKKFVRTARRYHTVHIKAGSQVLTAADPVPDDLRDALAMIRGGGVH